MIVFAIVIVLWALALFGLGRWVAGALGTVPGLKHPAAAGLLGIALAQTLAMLWNFRFPISPGFSAAMLGIGLLGHALSVARSGPRLSRGQVVVLVLGSAMIAPWLMARVHMLHDVGYYQLPVVLWSQQSGIPLGLANLNPRMGFNSSWFVLDAMLRRPLQPADTLPSPGVSVVTGMLLACAVDPLRRMTHGRARAAVVLGAVATVLLLGTGTAVNGLNSPASDLPVMIAWVAIGLLMMRADDGERDATVILAATIAATATSIKVSALPMMLVPAVFAWRARVSPRAALVAALAAGVVLLPWLARGYWTSGCALFPLESTCWPHAWWSTPTELVRAEAVNVKNWAREPYWSDAGVVRANWIVPWTARLIRNAEVQVPAIAAALSLVLGARARCFGTGPAAAAMTAGVVAQVLMVLLDAPDPRFFMGALWVTAFALAWRAMRDAPASRWALFAGIAIVAAAPALLQGWRDQSRGLRHIGQAPALWFSPPRLDPTVPYHWQAVDGGRVRVPDPAPPLTACWAIAPPCTTVPLDDVHFRMSADGSRMVAIVRDAAR